MTLYKIQRKYQRMALFDFLDFEKMQKINLLTPMVWL